MKKLLTLLALLAPSLAFAAVGSLSLGGLLESAVYLAIVGLIFWCIWWFIEYVALKEPFNKAARGLLGLAALIIVVNLLLGLVGSPIFTLR